MKVSEVFDFFPQAFVDRKNNRTHPHFEKEFRKLNASTTSLEVGDIFCAYKGTTTDSHQFIEEALKKGIFAVIAEDEKWIPKTISIPYLILSDVRQAIEFLSSKFFHQIDQKLYTIGVTGTNGKTSVTYLVEYLSQQLNAKLGVIGTVNHRVGDKVWPTDLTTPDPWTLHERLDQFYKLNATGVILEVSSHALDQKRVSSLNFDAVIFTNLTRDHLDYHKTMLNYFKAKQILFYDLMWKSSKPTKLAIINGDDIFGRKLKIPVGVEKITYGKKANNDFSFSIFKSNFDGQTIELKHFKKKWKFSTPLIGEHSIYNLIPVIILGLKNGISIEQSTKIFKSFSGVPGRLQRVVNARNLNVFIDYAHSPDALKKILTTLNTIRKENKLKIKIITIFGCGGDRDKGKRPLMGRIAETLSDKVILTSDNPRTEDPMTIIKDITKGIKNKKLILIEPNRAKAIQSGLELMDDVDVLIICGKGHEDYQIIGHEKSHFSDLGEVKKHLDKE